MKKDVFSIIMAFFVAGVMVVLIVRLSNLNVRVTALESVKAALVYENDN